MFLVVYDSDYLYKIKGQTILESKSFGAKNVKFVS